ncbi:MAG: DUF992 domain-containing protein, partial [Mariprofundales bacterium]|nr:DUF992 domain-containing protein [Mariprofundales bacterium]
KRVMKKSVLSFAALALAGSVAFASPVVAAETSAGAKIGVMSCDTVPNSGFTLLIHSTVGVKCVFKSSQGVVEHYKGETGVGLGIDLNYDRKTHTVYSVLAADFKKGSYQMAGKYVGAGASASLGVGVGAHALIGGNNKSITLNPLAVSGQKGVGIEGGLTYLYLEPDYSADK